MTRIRISAPIIFTLLYTYITDSLCAHVCPLAAVLWHFVLPFYFWSFVAIAKLCFYGKIFLCAFFFWVLDELILDIFVSLANAFYK